MKNYSIKQNGYTIGQAKGKNNAIQALGKIFVINNVTNEEARALWGKFIQGKLTVRINEEVFTIEEMK